MSTLEERVAAIEARNRHVEGNKTWETSWQRRAAVCLLTYVVAAAWMLVLNIPNVFVAATVPVVGYLLSTLSLRWLRNIFERQHHD